MKTSELSTSKYLKQSDIEQPQLVTITGVTKKNVAPPDAEVEMKGVMTFSELEKPMVLNWFNTQVCENAFRTDEMDDWEGKQIVIYVDPTIAFGGKITGGIRLRAPKQQKPAAPPVKPGSFAEMDDDIPF